MNNPNALDEDTLAVSQFWSSASRVGHYGAIQMLYYIIIIISAD